MECEKYKFLMKLHVKLAYEYNICDWAADATMSFYEKGTTKCCNNKISSQTELFASWFF